MNKFANYRFVMVALLCFAVSLGLSACAEAAGKRTPEDQLKALRADLRNAHQELRRLNEEGGPEAQERAQQLMERIGQIKEQIAQIEEKLGNGH